MAKTTSKRKSESALPIGRSKHRKISTSKDDDPDSNEGSGEASGESFDREKVVAPKYVKKAAVRSRKSEPVRRKIRDDEYEEDEGRIDSQHFLALVEAETKKKQRAAKAASKYMDKFEENISSSNDGLKMQLAKLTADSTEQDAEFLATFQNAYAASRPRQRPSPSNPSDPNELRFVTLFDRSRALIKSAHSLISCFEAANEKTEKCEVAELLDHEWENETVAKILAVGCNVGIEKYQALLRGSGEPVVDGENEYIVEGIYGGDGKVGDGSGNGWGKVAKKGEKAAKKFVKFQRVVVA